MNHVAVVTDSTAYLPSAQAAAAHVTVVPVQVVVGGQTLDETDVSSADIAEALTFFTRWGSLNSLTPAMACVRHTG